MKRVLYLFLTAGLIISALTMSCNIIDPKFTVKFDAKGGSPTPPEQEIKEGEMVKKPEDPTREGYIFGGWSKADNETSALWNFDTEKVLDNWTLYARWSIRSYQVTFDSDGAGAVAAQNIAHGSTATKPADPTRAEHIFDGWFSGDAEWNFSAAITGPLALKAKWSKAHTVTFDADNGSAVTTQAIRDGEKTTKPANPTRAFPATAELYVNPIDLNALPSQYNFVEWRKDGENTAFDFDAPITASTTLKAVWSTPAPEPVNISAQSGANRIEQTFAYVNANPGDYTLLVGADMVITSQTINTSNVKLAIIGIGGMRKISFRSTGTLITVGAAQRIGISLTIGANITLNGSNNSTANYVHCFVVRVTEGAEFIMLEGSEISENSSGYYMGNAVAAAVWVDAGSTFTMKGGEIKDNNSGRINNTTITGVRIEGGNFNMEGGKITNNKNGDLYISPSSTFSLSGNAEAGTVLFAASATSNASASISADWTGRFNQLNLYGGDTTMANIIGWWVGKPMLTGAGVIAANVAKFPLGFFFDGNTSQAITLHEINSSGVFVTK